MKHNYIGVNKILLVVLLIYYMFLIVFWIALAASEILDDLSIISVSTSLDTINSPRDGSYYGGTTLYIRGTGFDTASANNLVTVGPIPCDTSPYGGSSTIIVCDTIRNEYSIKYYVDQNSLTITVKVGNRSTSCDASSCKFSYQKGYTPYL